MDDLDDFIGAWLAPKVSALDDMRSWLNGAPVPRHAELLKRWGKDFLMYRDAWLTPGHLDEPFDVAESARRQSEWFRIREEQAIPEFGFSIPCAEVLDALAEHQPILEIGAGTGYWTALMRHRGIDVIGTDPDEQGWWKQVGQYDPTQVKLEARQALRQWSDRTVFCSWPSYKEIWFHQALKTMYVGRRLILIEEDVCADDNTWKYRDRNFELLAPIRVPAWPGMNDRCGVWRKEQRR